MKKRLTLLLITTVVSSVLAEVTEVKASYQRHLTFEAGKVGNAAVFSKGSKLQFNSQYIKANSGTLEVWIKTQNPPAKQVAHLFSIGTNNPLWFIVSLDDKNLAILDMEKGQKGFKYYATLKHNIQFNADIWTHLALVWAYRKPGECVMQIYINGKLVEEKFNMTIGQAWTENDKGLGIGFSTANFAAPSYNGAMDELRISNYPKTPSAIKKAYKTVSKGKALTAEPGTLLLLHFDNTANGQSKTQKKLDLKEVNSKCEAILDELYP